MFSEILKAISNAIGEYASNYSVSDPKTIKQFQVVKVCYDKIKEENRINHFYEFLCKEYKDDSQLFCIIFSILYEISGDELILDIMYEWLINSDLDIFLLNSIRYQITYKIFVKISSKSFYEEKMILHNKVLKQISDMIDIKVHKIPACERDKKQVIIVTDQLLNQKHAPTAVVYRISTILKKFFGFQVQIVCMQTVISKEVINYWVSPRLTNGAEATGGIIINPFGVEIPVYYMPMKETNIENIKQLYQAVYDLKPIFSWYIGGESIVGDFIGQMTTSISMPCTNGYGISNADYMITYKKDDSDRIQQQERYLLERKQSLLHLKLVSDHREQYTGGLTRDMIGVTPKDYLITIVGNRLNNELTDDLINVLGKIKLLQNNIKFVFVGEVSNTRCSYINQILGEEQVYLGFREDLIDVISLCDLMINPPRIGGGGSAVMACAMGIPIISLKQCDVSMVIGEEMCCNELDEYVECAKRYIFDKSYWEEQSNCLKKNYENKGVDRFHKYLGDMLYELSKHEGFEILN